MKNVLFMKSDKGNAMVIMDKEDYEERMENLITNGPYEEIIDGRLIDNNPVNSMQKEVKDLLKDFVTNRGMQKFKANNLTESHPEVSKMYALPKVHKEGKKMRPIISCCNTPSRKLSKWVSDEIAKLEIIREFEVKNSVDFCRKMKDVKISEDEMMVSFDVESLFPSVPLEKTLNVLKNHLGRKNINKNLKEMIMKAAELSMHQNQFQYKNRYYKQKSGLAIGNPLSPTMASLFMMHFENKIKTRSWFPRIYCRYVDDIYAIIKKKEVENVYMKLNEQFPEIKFTVETEIDGKLPFLDLLVKNENGKVKFEIYHKPTSTQQYIPNDSHHCTSHKLAAFNSMIDRMLKIPMDREDYEKELKYVLDCAMINGYEPSSIMNLVRKHKKKIATQTSTSLKAIENDSLKPMVLPFYPEITNRIKRDMKKQGYRVVHENSGKLSDLIVKLKDKVENDNEKAGIYLLECKDCDASYVGQTKRNIGVRFKEHKSDCLKEVNEDKPMPKHMIQNNHEFKDITLLKEVRNKQQLDVYESIFLKKLENRNLTNIQKQGNCISNLIKFSLELA